MFLKRENLLRGQVEGGWALDIETFFGPVKWHRAVRRVLFGAQKSRDIQDPTPSRFPKLWIFLIAVVEESSIFPGRDSNRAHTLRQDA
jgi:hypothetical protein